MSEVAVNFVAFNEARDACLMVLVEGPWAGDVEEHLRGLQDRMFGCLDAPLDGQLAEQLPEAMGKDVIVRVDCYDVPRDTVEGFFNRFAEGIGNLPDYSADSSKFINQFRFELNFDTLDSETEIGNEPLGSRQFHQPMSEKVGPSRTSQI